MLSALVLPAQLSSASTDIRLEGLDGQWHRLSEYIGHGKWTAVNIWGPGCPPCQEEMPELVMFHDEHHETNATVVGIAIDFPSYGYADKKQVAEFVDDYLVSFPILLADASVTQKMGVGILRGVPTTYMYNPKGKLVGYQLGGITKAIIEAFIERHESVNKQNHNDNVKN